MKNKDKKINEVKKEMENLKKDFDKNYLSLETKLKKLEKGAYEIGDEVKWCNLDWYVIGLDDKNKLTKLMLKNTLQSMAYSDNNSNDWNYSNVRAYLNDEFINKLDEDKLQLMNINYDERLIAHDYVAIPTLRDIERLPMSIRNCGKSYWTMTASYGVSEDCSYAVVFFVNAGGYLYSTNVNNTDIGLRPVITLSTDELLGL